VSCLILEKNCGEGCQWRIRSSWEKLAVGCRGRPEKMPKVSWKVSGKVSWTVLRFGLRIHCRRNHYNSRSGKVGEYKSSSTKLKQVENSSTYLNVSRSSFSLLNSSSAGMLESRDVGMQRAEKRRVI